ncbi:unnamed protein product [Prorocentrum cordatum]|uniref:Uncharacterized protein n=1 Tax=Prorocentrum cordatum TaxID=2364126 RepID=A0ABN9VD08_9DINO|nr:unnamed protein product [Polarella glacialis]
MPPTVGTAEARSHGCPAREARAQGPPAFQLGIARTCAFFLRREKPGTKPKKTGNGRPSDGEPEGSLPSDADREGVHAGTPPPEVTVHYGGRLIAPFRAGTDLSQMLCALLSEAQAPRGAGGPLLFPSWVLQVLYAALAAAGLASWMGVVGSAAGLRRPEAQQPEPRGPPSKAEAAPGGRRGRLRGFACPASLAWPVLLGGVVTQVNLWALTVPVGNSSARMTDPESCGGDQAAVLYKVGLTLQYCLVPLASLLSSLARCPRPLFYGLFALQCACVAAVWLSLLGVGREALWQTAPGRTVWCAAFALIGGLEGYLLTMTYRYVGDDPGLAAHLRDGACRLMSWGGVMATNLLSLAIGICILRGGLACVEPDT